MQLTVQVSPLQANFAPRKPRKRSTMSHFRSEQMALIQLFIRTCSPRLLHVLCRVNMICVIHFRSCGLISTSTERADNLSTRQLFSCTGYVVPLLSPLLSGPGLSWKALAAVMFGRQHKHSSVSCAYLECLCGELIYACTVSGFFQAQTCKQHLTSSTRHT